MCFLLLLARSEETIIRYGTKTTHTTFGKGERDAAIDRAVCAGRWISKCDQKHWYDPHSSSCTYHMVPVRTLGQRDTDLGLIEIKGAKIAIKLVIYHVKSKKVVQQQLHVTFKCFSTVGPSRYYHLARGVQGFMISFPERLCKAQSFYINLVSWSVLPKITPTDSFSGPWTKK